MKKQQTDAPMKKPPTPPTPEIASRIGDRFFIYMLRKLGIIQAPNRDICLFWANY